MYVNKMHAQISFGLSAAEPAAEFVSSRWLR